MPVRKLPLAGLPRRRHCQECLGLICTMILQRWPTARSRISFLLLRFLVSLRSTFHRHGFLSTNPVAVQITRARLRTARKRTLPQSMAIAPQTQ